MEAWNAVLPLFLQMLQTAMAATPSIDTATASITLGVIAAIYLLLSIGLAVCIICILCRRRENAYQPNESALRKKGAIGTHYRKAKAVTHKKPPRSSQENGFRPSQEKGSLELTTFRKVSHDLSGSQAPQGSTGNPPQPSALLRTHSRTSYDDTLRTSTFTANFVDPRGVPKQGVIFENKLFEVEAQKSHSSSSSQPSDEVFLDAEPVVNEDQPSPLPSRDEIKKVAQLRRRAVERTSSTKPLLQGSESEDFPTPSPMEDVAPFPGLPYGHTPTFVPTPIGGHTYASPSHDIARERPRPSPAHVHRRMSPVPTPLGMSEPTGAGHTPVQALSKGRSSSMDLLDDLMKEVGDHMAPLTSLDDDAPMPRGRLGTDV